MGRTDDARNIGFITILNDDDDNKERLQRLNDDMRMRFSTNDVSMELVSGVGLLVSMNSLNSLDVCSRWRDREKECACAVM